MLSPGQTIDRYTVDSVIGHGGTAVVYLVRHNQLGSAGLIIASGGGLTVNGGTASATMISAGGIEYVATGIDTGAIVLGQHQVWSGATATTSMSSWLLMISLIRSRIRAESSTHSTLIFFPAKIGLPSP